MFTEKQSKHIEGCQPENDKVLPYDELQAELFYPTWVDICQTKDIAHHLAKKAALTFLIDFCDTSKAALTYLSSIGGKYNASKISKRR